MFKKKKKFKTDLITSFILLLPSVFLSQINTINALHNIYKSVFFSFKFEKFIRKLRSNHD